MENIVCYEKVIIPKGCSFLARYDQEATIDTLELHAHDEVEFQFTLSGYGIRTLGEVSEPFKEMEVLLIPGGMPHNWVYQNPEGTRIQEYSVQFPKGLVTSQLAAFPEFSNIVSFIEGLESAIEIRGGRGIPTVLDNDEDDYNAARRQAHCPYPDAKFCPEMSRQEIHIT